MSPEKVSTTVPLNWKEVWYHQLPDDVCQQR